MDRFIVLCLFQLGAWAFYTYFLQATDPRARELLKTPTGRINNASSFLATLVIMTATSFSWSYVFYGVITGILGIIWLERGHKVWAP